MEPTNIRTSDIENWFGYHEPKRKTDVLHEDVRQDFNTIAHTLNHLLPDGRTKFEVFKQLEIASMWAHKAIDELSPIVND